MSGLRDHQLRLLISSSIAGGRVAEKVVQAALQLCGHSRRLWQGRGSVPLAELRSILGISEDRWNLLIAQPPPLPPCDNGDCCGLQLCNCSRSDTSDSVSQLSLSSQSQSRIEELERQVELLTNRAMNAEQQTKHQSKREYNRRRSMHQRACDKKRRRCGSQHRDQLV